MPDLQKINNAIDKIILGLSEMKQGLADYANVAQPAAASYTPVNQGSTNTVQNVSSAVSDDLGSFESLKNALNSPKWPEAVNPNLICSPDDENDKLERGRGIIELMIEEDIKGLKVLDFGCGQGQCAFVASDYDPALSVGYDIRSYEQWGAYEKDNVFFTRSFEDVKEKGPYDIIVLFDVLDHVKQESPTEILAKAKQVLSKNGKIYMRCHPFISRHGTHLYHDLNKAYVHLVFTPSELYTLVPNPKWAEDSIGVITPIKTYENFIHGANLTISSRRDVTEKVEPFFKIPKIAERIMSNCKIEHYPEFQMSLQFIDFVLVNK